MTGDIAPEDKDFGGRLAQFDEAIRRGKPIDVSADSLPPGDADDVSAALECLERIEQLWPRAVAAAGRHELDTFRQLPRHVGRFEIRRELGRGAFGVVFLAHDPAVGRDVALKIPRIEALLTADLRDRFLNESRAVARLDHPNVVPVFEAGEADGICYIASGFCAGGTLADWLEKQAGSMSPRPAAQLIAALADAVQHAHEQGVLHRDLKPANVMLVPQAGGQPNREEFPFLPRLTDFGLAKVFAESLTDTRSSVVLGTPLYMSPEQAEGRAAMSSERTDVYGLGVILFELLTGRPPFQSESLVEVLDQLRSDACPSPRSLNSQVSRDLEIICLKCLQRIPDQRYASAAELASDLRRFLNSQVISARPLTRLQRIGNWCRRPERMRDAGVITTGVGATFSIWFFAMCAVQSLSAFDWDRQGGNFISGIVFECVMYIPAIWLGIRIIKRQAWAMIVVIVEWGLAVILLIGSIAGTHINWAEKALPEFSGRVIIEIMFIAMYLLVVVVNCIALAANCEYRRNLRDRS